MPTPFDRTGARYPRFTGTILDAILISQVIPIKFCTQWGPGADDGKFRTIVRPATYEMIR